MRKDARFGMALTSEERETLRKIAEQRRTSESAVVRWLIWREKQRRERLMERRQLCTA